jgi:hypothetical protein
MKTAAAAATAAAATTHVTEVKSTNAGIYTACHSSKSPSILSI